MTRFQQMISEDMVPSVSVLHRAIENAASRNPAPRGHGQRGLTAGRVQPGTHLQIACNASQFEVAKDFRGQWMTCSSNAPAARRNPQASLASSTGP